MGSGVMVRSNRCKGCNDGECASCALESVGFGFVSEANPEAGMNWRVH